MQSSDRRTLLPAWNAIAAAIVVVHVGLLLYEAWIHSPNDLEVNLLPAGYLHLRYGRFDSAQVNTPLSRIVCAVPLCLAFDVNEDWGDLIATPGSRSEFAVGKRFLELNRASFREMFFAGRAVAILFSIVGACSVHAIAGRLYGCGPAVGALVIWCFCPMVLGHGATVNHDVPGAAMAALCFLTWLRLAEAPCVNRVLLCGVASGTAVLTRTTNVALILLWMFLFTSTQLQLGLRRTLFRCVVPIGIVALVALFMLNVGYEFSGTMTRLGDFKFVSHLFNGSRPIPGLAGDEDILNRFRGTPFEKILVPLPRDFVIGLDLQQRDFESPAFPSYLCGEWRERGWWYFFLVAWLVKTPMGFQLLFYFAVAGWVMDLSQTKPVAFESWLLSSVLMTFALASAKSGFTVHFRYVLPAIPFVAIFSSRLWTGRSVPTVWRYMSVALLVAGVISSLGIFPHSLAYFQELIGGPREGGRYLLHSNLDWGQDLNLLADWLAQNRTGQVRESAMQVHSIARPYIAGIPGNSVPRRRDPDGRRSDGEEEITPGVYLVSVSYLFAASGGYRYLTALTPAGSIGYSINIYEITKNEIETRGWNTRPD